MKVRATQKGYYKHALRRPGVEFEITEESHFSKKWMEKVVASPEAVPISDQQPNPTPVKAEPSPKPRGRPRKKD